MELEDRSLRIVETAVELAEQGGFEAVRLRDVAAHAGVALGTLYRRFRSKEDLLIAALEREMEALERRVVARPPEGATETARLDRFFATVTRNLCGRPHLARAMLRALVSGDPQLAQRVAGFHERMLRLTVATLRGARPEPRAAAAGDGGASAGAGERGDPLLAWHLDMVWFALIIGWSSGVHAPAEVVQKMAEATRLAVEGARRAA